MLQYLNSQAPGQIRILPKTDPDFAKNGSGICQKRIRILPKTDPDFAKNTYNDAWI